MLTHQYLYILILTFVPKLNFALTTTKQSHNESQEFSPSSFTYLLLNKKKLVETSNQHIKITKSLNDSDNIIENVRHQTNHLFKSLKSLKLVNSSKKKKVYPVIVFSNVKDTQLHDEIEDDLAKFEAYSKLLSQLMHSIVNKDLGLSEMQQQVDKLFVKSDSIHFENILYNITEKVCLLLLFLFCAVTNYFL